MDSFSEIFQLMIQDHGRNPRHYGKPEAFDGSASGVNPLTGDTIEVYLVFDDAKTTLRNISFTGKASALATTSASVMSGVLKGLSRVEALEKIEETLALLAGGEDSPTDEAVLPEDEFAVLTEIRRFPHRQKCVTLAWQTAEAALSKAMGMG